MSRAAAIYCRISDDRAGDSAGVRRQEADCRALADRKGWTVAGVYVDNDTGAWGSKPRPQYRKLLDDLKAGTVDAVIVWHLDRLTRRPAELESFFEICDAAGIKDLASCTGDVDLSTDDGRFMARILGAVARKESDDKSRRTKRKHLELAEAGVPVGGTRPFGYDDDKVTIRPAEAALIREAAKRVLAGDTLRALALDWNASGTRPPRDGSRWRSTAIRRILLSPRIVGKRALGDVIVADGQWSAILDETTQARVRAVIEDRARAHRGGFGARTHLLTGLLVCGKCGTRLIARPQSARRRTYVCTSDPSKGGCGGIRIVAHELEHEIVERILHVLATDTVALARERSSSPANYDELVAAIAADEATLEQLAADHYVEQVISRAQFLAASQRLDDRITALRRRIAATQRSEIVRSHAGPMSLEEWEALPFDRRRTVLEELVETIKITSAVPGRNRFDPDRAHVTWRSETTSM